MSGDYKPAPVHERIMPWGTFSDVAAEVWPNEESPAESWTEAACGAALRRILQLQQALSILDAAVLVQKARRRQARQMEQWARNQRAYKGVRADRSGA